MKLTRKVSGIIAGGGAMALVAGAIAYSGGVGASFSDAATAFADISVGTLACELSSTNGAVEISNQSHTATVHFTKVNTAAAGSSVVPLTVANTGSSDMTIRWTAETSGNLIRVAPSVLDQVRYVTAGSSTTYDNLGFSWPELYNGDQGTSGSVTYHFYCNQPDVVTAPDGVSLYYSGAGSITGDADTVTFHIPENNNSPADGAGTSIQLNNPGGALPVNQPEIRATNVYGGTPQMVVWLSEGHLMVGWPYANRTNAQNGPYWTLLNLKNDGKTWNTLATGSWSIVSGAVPAGVVVERVLVNSFSAQNATSGVSDGDNHPAEDVTITCVNFNGRIFGSGC